MLGIYDEEANPDGATVTPCESMTGPSGEPGIIGSMHSGHPDVAHRDVSGRRFASYFSGNVTQICPVGRSRMPPIGSGRVPTISYLPPRLPTRMLAGQKSGSTHAAVVLRHLAGDNPEVNEEWISDKDRYAFAWQSSTDRLTRPMVRNDAGELEETDWGTALSRAAAYVKESAQNSEVTFFPGEHLTLEDYYAWGKFAHVVGKSNIVDARARDFRMDEVNFIKLRVAGRPVTVTYQDIEKAPFVFLVDLEPEDECATLFLRLRKATQNHGTKVATLAPFLSDGARKLAPPWCKTSRGSNSRFYRHHRWPRRVCLGERIPQPTRCAGADGGACQPGR
ncbi:NADH-quinone oxidoreductase subunit 3 [Mobiluncus curtisii]|uniref:NADH-quinone oxidoreductase subunit 3 n=1 Tax=Mobiluncus curtisii TaxID=2051 RepID=A0A2X3BL72_9ACTO|nr:NADH-quinone oxidoreductase subunit 3 [Mobiluncus curtisii]